MTRSFPRPHCAANPSGRPGSLRRKIVLTFGKAALAGLAALCLSPAAKGNTDTFLQVSTSGTDLSLAATYIPTGVPTSGTDDVEFTNSTYTGSIFDTNGVSLNYGTLDDMAGNPTVTILTNSTTPSTLSLSDVNGNGISGVLADLIYVAFGDALTIGGGTGNLTLNLANNGNIDDAGTLTLLGPISIVGSDTITFTGAGTTTVNGNIASGGASIVVSAGGGGTVTLAGNDAYTGTTTVENGTLIAGSNAPAGNVGAFGIATSAIVLGDANSIANGLSPTLLTGAAVTIGRNITVGANSGATSGVFTIGGNAAVSSAFSGVITLNQPLTITQVPGGTLNLNGTIVSGVSGAQMVTINETGNFTEGSGGGIGGGASGGVISLTLAGTGNVTLLNNTYTGNTYVDSGFVNIGGNAQAFGVGGTVYLGLAGSSNTVTLESATNVSYPLVVEPGGIEDTDTNGGNGFTITGPITLVGGATFQFGANGNATMGISGGVTGTGNLQLGSPFSGRSSTINVTGAAINMVGTLADSVTGGGNMTGNVNVSALIGPNVTGLLQNSTTATFVLSNANTFPGDTVISTGTLNVQNANALQDSVVNLTGGTLTFGTASISIPSATLGGLAGTGNLALVNQDGGGILNLTLGNSNVSNGSASNPNTLSPIYTGNLVGGGTLTKIGSNMQTLSGTDTYTGSTTVSSGTLEFSLEASLYNNHSVAAWNATNIIVNSGATLMFRVGGTGNFSAADLVTLSGLGTASGGFENGSILGIDTTGGSFVPTAAIANTNGGANALGLTVTGANALTLPFSNTYTGPTTIIGTPLILTGTLGAGASGGTAITNNGGTFNESTGSITGTSSFTNLAGTATLSGSNSYTGKTIVSGGSFQLTNEVSLYKNVTSNWTAANITVGNGATLAFNIGGTGQFTASDVSTLLTAIDGVVNNNGLEAGSAIGFDTTNALTGSFTLSSPISNTTGPRGGAVGLTKLGFGTLVVSNTNNYTGSTSINAGTLSLTGTLGGGTNGGTAINNNATFTESSTGVVAGASSVTNTAGATTLGGVNSYTGPTMLIAGTISLTGSIGIGTNGGTAISNNGGTFTESSTGLIGGTSSVTNNLGTTSLGNSGNSYTGGTTVNGGTVIQTAANAFGSASGQLTVNSGAIADLGGHNLGVGNLTGGGGVIQDTGAAATLTIGNGNGTGGNYAGTIGGGTGVISLVKTGGGTITLSGSNTFTGPTAVSGGTLNLGNEYALQYSVASISGGGLVFSPSIGIFNLGGLGGSTALSLQDTGGSAITLILGNTAGTSATYSGNLSGGGSLVQAGPNTQALAGINTYTGATTVDAGALEFVNETSLYNYNTANWTPANILVLPNSTLAFEVGSSPNFTSSDIATLLANVGGNSSGGFQAGSFLGIDTSGGSITYPSAITNFNNGENVLGLIKTGANTLVLNASNTYTGATTITSGSLQLGSGGATGALSPTSLITDNGFLVFDRSNNITQGVDFSPYAIAGTGGLTQEGGSSSVLYLTATNTFTGVTTVISGSIDLKNQGALQNSILASGGTGIVFDSSVASHAFTIGGLSGSGNLALTDNGSNAVALTLGNSAGTAASYSGNLTGGGSLIKIDSNSQTLSGVGIAYSGPTVVNGGTLIVNGGLLSGGTALSFGGGIFSLATPGSVTQNFSGTAINAGESGISAISGDAINLGIINRKIGGTVNFSSTGTIDTSTTANVGGILGGYATVGGSTWAVPPASGGGAITGLASYTTASTTASTDNGANIDLNFSSGTNIIPSGAITPNSIRFSGAAANTLSLTGINTIASGGILVTSGVGSNTSTITGGTIEGSAGGDLVINYNNTAGTLNIASVIADNSSATAVTYAGNAGTFTLNGNNTFSGGLYLDGGFVNAGSSVGLGSSISGQANGLGQVYMGAYGSAFTVGMTINSNVISNPLTVYPGGLRYIYQGGGGGAYAGNVTLIGGATLTFGPNGGTITLSSPLVSGTGNLNFLYPSSVRSNETTNVNGGTLNIVGTITDSIQSNGSGTINIKDVIGPSVTGLFQASTTGVIVLTNTNTFTGDTVVSAGVLNIQNSAAALENSVVNLTGGSVTFGASSAVGLAATAFGGLGGSGNLSLVDTTGSPITLTLGNSNVSNGSSTNPNTISPNYFGTLSGGGTLVMMGPDTQTLSGSNTYTGGTIVNGGVLRLGNLFALGSTSNLVTVNGGELDVNGNSPTFGPVAGSGGIIANSLASTTSALIINLPGGEQTYAGSIQNGAGTVGLTMVSGNQILSGSSTYTGTTAINGGVLTASGPDVAGISGALGNGGRIVFGGGTLQFGTSGIDYSSRIVNGASPILIDTDGNNINFASPLAASNTGGLIETDSAESGILTLSAGNAYIGPTIVEDHGTLQLGISQALPAATTLYLGGQDNSPGTFDLNGNTQTVAGLVSQGSDAVQTLVTNSASMSALLTVSGTGGTFAGTITDGPAATVAFTLLSGTENLSGNNTYSGPTTVSGGRLIVSGALSGNGYQDSTVSVAANGHFEVDGQVANTTPISVSGYLSGSGSLGPVTINSGGTFAPGFSTLVSTTGIMSVAGNVSLNSNSKFNIRVGLGATASFDQLDVSGGVISLNSASVFVFPGVGTVTAGDLYTIILGTAPVSGMFGNADTTRVGTDTYSFNSGGVSWLINYDYDGSLGQTATGISATAFENITGGDDVALLAVVPEPGTWAMLLGGMGMLAVVYRRRR